MQVTEFLVAFGSLADASNSFISLRFYGVMESRRLLYSLSVLNFPGVCWNDLLFVSYSASFLSVSWTSDWRSYLLTQQRIDLLILCLVFLVSVSVISALIFISCCLGGSG